MYKSFAIEETYCTWVILKQMALKKVGFSKEKPLPPSFLSNSFQNTFRFVALCPWEKQHVTKKRGKTTTMRVWKCPIWPSLLRNDMQSGGRRGGKGTLGSCGRCRRRRRNEESLEKEEEKWEDRRQFPLSVFALPPIPSVTRRYIFWGRPSIAERKSPSFLLSFLCVS